MANNSNKNKKSNRDTTAAKVASLAAAENEKNSDSATADYQPLCQNANSVAATVLKLCNSSDVNTNKTKSGKQQLFEHKQICMTIGLKHIPTERHAILIQLPVNPHLDTDSACVITKDLIHNPKDYEATAAHYTELIAKAKSGLELTVLPLRELTLAYMPFEAKRTLCNSYDYFLADKTIVHRLGNKLGKYFLKQNKKKIPIPVDLHADNLKRELQLASRTVRITMTTGSTVSCLVGHSEMTVTQLVDNVQTICTQLANKLPNGGASNITGLYLTSPIIGNVPLYVPCAPSAKESGESKIEVADKEDKEEEEEEEEGNNAKKKGGLIDKQLRELSSSLWDPTMVRVPRLLKRKRPGKIANKNNSSKNSKKPKVKKQLNNNAKVVNKQVKISK